MNASGKSFFSLQGCSKLVSASLLSAELRRLPTQPRVRVQPTWRAGIHLYTQTQSINWLSQTGIVYCKLAVTDGYY